jgi:integrase
VTVWPRPRATGGTVYVGRYTVRPGVRPVLPATDSWDEAFELAAAEQRRVDRGRSRGGQSGRMTFTELVRDHWAPTVIVTSKNTTKNHASHLGDGTGRPQGKGAKAQRAVRFQLLNRFGPMTLAEIGAQDVRSWQSEMVKAGYAHSSILAKRSLLRCILQVAVVNGWIDLNWVDAVPEPPKVQTSDEDQVIAPADWTLIRSRLTGDTTLLLVDTLLDSGVRYGEATALRPVDLIDADEDEPCHLWVRRTVIWPGRRYTDGDQPWEIKEYPKGRRWRRVAVSPALFNRHRAYIEANQVGEGALIFDYGRLRAEHAVQRNRDPLPMHAPTGRYISPKTGRSGAHGRYTTYNLGCRCPFCRNAYSEYRFWWARGRGRRAAQPWLEPDFLSSRGEAIDPCPHQWFGQSVWNPAVREVCLGWEPTLHDLRHAMVTWSLDGGAPARVVQKEAGHNSLRTTEGYEHRMSDRVTDERVKAMARMYPQLVDEPARGAPAPTLPDPEDILAAALAALPPERVGELLVRALRGPAPDRLHVAGE